MNGCRTDEVCIIDERKAGTAAAGYVVMLAHIFTEEQMQGHLSLLHMLRSGKPNQVEFAQRGLVSMLRRHGCTLADFEAQAIHVWASFGLDHGPGLDEGTALALDHCRGCADATGQRADRFIRLLPFSGSALAEPSDQWRAKHVISRKDRTWWQPWR